MKEEEIREHLIEKFPDATIKLMDLTGGGDHWRLEIRSAAFKGQNMVQQHQTVYRALGDLMKTKIHALSLDTGEK